MSVQRFSFQLSKHVSAVVLIAGLGAVLTSTLGCRIEQAPTRIERAEYHLAELADHPLPVHPGPNADEAEQVIMSCGQPDADSVVPVYTKYYNGPVRRLEYAGQRTQPVGGRPVMLDFIPSMPKARLAFVEAPLPHDGNGYGALTPNATWQFQAGYMEQQQMVTAHSVGVYLPCAGKALRAEF